MSMTGMPSVMQTTSGRAGIDRFQDGVGGERPAGHRSRWHWRRSWRRIRDRVEDRQVEMGGAAFAGRDAAHHLGAVGDRLLGVKGALGAGEALGR